MEIKEAIEHPKFSHARQGDRCWRDVIWIYHFDSDSPSGVKLVSSGYTAEVEPMLRKIQKTSQLSPTER
jgi:hypothetical protein